MECSLAQRFEYLLDIYENKELSTNPIAEEINDVYSGLLALSKLFVQSNPKDTQQMCHEEWEEGFVPRMAAAGGQREQHCLTACPAPQN